MELRAPSPVRPRPGGAGALARTTKTWRYGRPRPYRVPHSSAFHFRGTYEFLGALCVLGSEPLQPTTKDQRPRTKDQEPRTKDHSAPLHPQMLHNKQITYQYSPHSY